MSSPSTQIVLIIVFSSLFGAAIFIIVATYFCLCCFYTVEWTPWSPENMEKGSPVEKRHVCRFWGVPKPLNPIDPATEKIALKQWGVLNRKSTLGTAPNIDAPVKELVSPSPVGDITLVTDPGRWEAAQDAILDEIINGTLATVLAAPRSRTLSKAPDTFDTLLHTVVLRNLVRMSNASSDYTIEKELDCYLDNTILVGGIVVVVRQFEGKRECDFPCLHPGDLLRIVRFYPRDNEKLSMRLFNQAATERPLTSTGAGGGDTSFESAVEDQPHCEFREPQIRYHPRNKIYCTGIVLNCYLEFTQENLVIRVREQPIATDDLVKDFPLNAVSLETTLLKNI